MRELTDKELSAILSEWEPVRAPESLRGRVLGARRRRWWMLAAAAMVLAGLAVGWRFRGTEIPERRPEAPRVDAKEPGAGRDHRGRRSVVAPRGKSGLSGLPLPLPAAAPKPIMRVEPVFPAGAKTAGMVRLNVRIGKDGRVVEPIVMSGDPVLVPAAVEAVKQWVYRPILLNGLPVEVVTQVELEVKP